MMAGAFLFVKIVSREAIGFLPLLPGTSAVADGHPL
jgi:hypothetical protein